MLEDPALLGEQYRWNKSTRQLSPDGGLSAGHIPLQ
jgi:hypothetical protein